MKTFTNKFAALALTIIIGLCIPVGVNAAIGIIPESPGQCPTGSEYLTIYMDDEDNNNKSNQSGWVGSILSNQGNTGTSIGVCRVSGAGFISHPRLPYAVIKFDALTDNHGSWAGCPGGSKEIRRLFDNENSNNQNSSIGSVTPNNINGNWRNKNWRLHFCYFEPTGGAIFGNSPNLYFPDLGISYGVFAAPESKWLLNTGFVYTDDEDNSNDNLWITEVEATPGGQSEVYESKDISEYGPPRVSEVMYGGKNTTLRVGKVRTKVMSCDGAITWWDTSWVTASFDGANCFVRTAPPGSHPFIYANSYYVKSQATTNCPMGSYDGANCKVKSGSPTPFIKNNSFYTLPKYIKHTYICPSGSQFDGENCFWFAAPWGTRAFVYNGNWYTTTRPTCMVGNFDGANCKMGSPPAGTNAFIYSNNFYYAE